ncbi:MAG TPA: NAD(P)-dependent oxidoreductase [Candidatus Saccharimonadales bacterium]|nr:NAD(P)-dependent oxidoreductase [Candidatus Saccharimonadales bacterium]
MKLFIFTPNANTLFTPEQLADLKAAGDVHLITEIKPFTEIAELYEGNEDRIVAIDPDFSDWSFPNDVIDKIPNLKAIVLQTTSFSWVDIEYCKAKNIPVMNLRGFSSIAVAEWGTMVALGLARRLPEVIRDGWKADYDKHRGIELRGKKAGVIGLGGIGTAFAKNMAGLGMDVQYWSRQARDERFTYASLEYLMKTSDVVFVSFAINEETTKLITDELLQTLKPSAIFVSLVSAVEKAYNQELLLEMVKTGKLYGLGYEQEKGTFGGHEGNVWDGPALGWCTNESMSKNAEQWVEATVAAAKGEYATRVN